MPVDLVCLVCRKNKLRAVQCREKVGGKEKVVYDRAEWTRERPKTMVGHAAVVIRVDKEK